MRRKSNSVDVARVDRCHAAEGRSADEVVEHDMT